MASVMFSTLRDLCNLKLKSKTKYFRYIMGAIIIIGTAVTVYPVIKGRGNISDYFPAASFLTYSIGQSLTKNAKQMCIIDAVDVALFWLVFDYANMLIICVVRDLFLLLVPFAASYAELDKDYYGDTDNNVPIEPEKI